MSELYRRLDAIQEENRRLRAEIELLRAELATTKEVIADERAAWIAHVADQAVPNDLHLSRETK